MQRSRPSTVVPLAVLIALAFAAAAGAGESEAAKVEAVLDDFHAAASAADEERYFSHFAAAGVFLGTDATERWTRDEFRAFVHPYFARGQGWTYQPRDRHVAVSAGGGTAWFDELLDNAKYGECRGTGVLQRAAGEWKIEQYHLTIPMPNELAEGFVATIREHAGRKDGG
jgi:ketosteroid isomerase-like protein